MAAVRHLEVVPDHRGPRAVPRHLRLVEPRPPVPSRRRQAGVYRRRRLAVGVVVTLVIVTGTRTLSSSVEAVTPPQEPVTLEVHVVQPGDSYWSIASSLDRPGDIRATVDALTESNDGRALQVGDRVSIPG